MATIDIRLASITDLDTDAVVNAANSGLKAGSGVCDAIFKAAGRERLQAACDRIGHCDTGSAVITPGYGLDAKFIIHAVGPVWNGGGNGEERLLYGAYKRALELAFDNGCRSIGFPLLSTGNRKYPVDKAWEPATRACLDFFDEESGANMSVVFAVRSEHALSLGKKALEQATRGDAREKVADARLSDHARFAKATICSLRGKPFVQLRRILTRSHLSFSIIKTSSVTPDMLAERSCGYFEMLEAKTGKPFRERQRAYLDALDSIVAPRIAERPTSSKKATTNPSIPRSRSYYDKARSIRDSEELTPRQLIDYSRIMFCLYTATATKDFATIENFDYSSKCLDPQRILQAMREEEVAALPIPFSATKPRFDTSDPYGADACTMLIATIVLYAIVNERVIREHDHE